MASPFMTSLRSPQCLSCIRRFEMSIGEGLRGPALQQVRGKKKMPKVATIAVKLLKDVPRYGPQGSVIAVARGRMRNEWFPKGLAEYMTVAKLKDEGLLGKVLERDSTFGVQKVFETKTQETEKVLPTLATKSTQAAIDAFKISAAKAEQIVADTLPPILTFERAPVAAPPPPPTRRVSPSIPSFAETSEGESSHAEPEQDSKVAIYGSVTTGDIAAQIKQLLAQSPDGDRVSVSAEDIEFAEAIEDGRVKHLGEYKIYIKVTDGKDPIVRTLHVVPRGDVSGQS